MAYVYVLECADATLYTGCTLDIAKRLEQHNYGRLGAKYTRARRPVKLVYYEAVSTLAAGQTREAAIKRLTRQEKLQLVQNKKPFP